MAVASASSSDARKCDDSGNPNEYPRRRIQVLLVSAVRFYAEGITLVLHDHPILRVIGCTNSDIDALRQVREVKPDVVLLDVGLDGAATLARALANTFTNLKVVALAVRDDDAEVITWAETGVSGLVTRDGSVSDLIGTVEAVSRGEGRCSPRATATLLRRVASMAAEAVPQHDPVAPLTTREVEIVELLVAGLTNKQIAGRLFIELATVKNHVHHIFEKLHVGRRSEAAAWGRRRAGQDSGWK